MNKTVLKRVKAGDFCTAMPIIIDSLPSFLDAEREELRCEVAILSEQLNIVRKNDHLRLLIDKFLPDLWRLISMLKMQLKSVSADDENAKELLIALGIAVPRRTNIDDVLFWIGLVCQTPAPSDSVSAAIYEQIKRHVGEMNEINERRLAEARRISSVGRCADTRRNIMTILQRIYEVAKGFSHIERHRAEAENVLESIDLATAILSRHMPRGKRKKKQSEAAAVSEKGNDVREKRNDEGEKRGVASEKREGEGVIIEKSEGERRDEKWENERAENNSYAKIT